MKGARLEEQGCARRAHVLLKPCKPGFPKLCQEQQAGTSRAAVLDGVAMVTPGSLLSNRPELREVA